MRARLRAGDASIPASRIRRDHALIPANSAAAGVEIVVNRILKRIALWILIFLGLILLLLAALQIFGPRVVNQEGIKNRIEAAVSKELGGRLQYKKIGFSILPWPRIVIRRPAFEIPGSISGSIHTLYIDFEPLSLLTGRPRIADADLDRPDFTFTLVAPSPASVPMATPPSEPPVAPVLGWLAVRMPNMAIGIEKGRWVFVDDRETLFSLDPVDGRIAFSPPNGSSSDAGKGKATAPFKIVGSLHATLTDAAKRSGPVRIQIGAFEAGPRAIEFSGGRLEIRDTTAQLSGRIEDYLSGSPAAEVAVEGTIGSDTIQWARTDLSLEALPPGPVYVRIGALKINPGSLAFSDSQIKWLDTALHFSGRIENYSADKASADFTADAVVGLDSVAWIRTAAALPPELTVRGPVSLSHIHFEWKTGAAMLVEGSASLPRDVSISFDLEQGHGFLSVHDLRVRDADSQAALAFDLRKKVLFLSFSGNLTESTLNRIFEEQRFKFGWVKGDFRSRAVLDRPRDSTARGRLEAERVILPFKTRLPVFIDRIAVQAADRTVRVDPLVLTLGNERHTVHGRVTARADDWMVDLKTDALQWKSLFQLFGSNTEEARSPSPKEDSTPLRAIIRVAAPSFTMAGWTAAPARVDIFLGPDPLRISVREAVVCGVNLPGMITVPSVGMTIDVKPSAHDQALESTLACLGVEHHQLTGTFDLSGDLHASGSGPALLDSLEGTVAADARDGRVNQDSVIIRILTYLNVTDLLRGQFSNLGNEGMPYKSAKILVTAKQGTLSLDEAVLTSPVVNLVGRGSIRPADKTMDLTVLAAPFTNIDKMIGKIPVIRDFLGGSLVTIPIRVTGPIDRPDVTTMPPGAVADEVAGMMKRVLQAPFKIIEPILPGAGKSR
jgi:AsmA-like C-terminal region